MNKLRLVEEKNTFEWQDVDYEENKNRFSPHFEINGYNCCISAIPISSKFIIGEMYLGFWLLAQRYPIFPLSYKMGVVDHRGNVFLARKGTVESNDWLHLFLGFVSETFLKENNVINWDTLTIRFIFEPNMGRQTDLEQSSASSSAVYNATQKVPLPLSTRDCSTNTDEESRNLFETLSKDLECFYECKKNTDCVLRVGEVQFPVHRAVLSARSSIFSAMFHHDTAENRSGEVNISDVDATALGDALYYVYSGKIRGLTVETATSMYTVADKYALTELRVKCLEFLKFHLSIENIGDAAVLANTHGETELEDRIIQFIVDKIEDVIESCQWREFSAMKPLLANKLVCTALMACKMKILEKRS